MSLKAWLSPNFWAQVKHFKPHKINGKWHFIKRDICLPYHFPVVVENRLRHLMLDPPLLALPLKSVITSSLFQRYMQANLERIYEFYDSAGIGWNHFFSRRVLKRMSVITAFKSLDPYWLGRKNFHYDRALDWLGDDRGPVPKEHGAGDSYGLRPKEDDYFKKIIRHVVDDKLGGQEGRAYFLSLFPGLCRRKYFNELPRMSYFSYGMKYTKEQMFKHIAFGIDPGNEKWQKQQQKPELMDFLQKQREMRQYYFPREAPMLNETWKNPDLLPDTNRYNPVYNRGSNRTLWGRYGL